MIRKLRLWHYKGFRSFTVEFGQSALLVGPNNAGKSSIIGALRLCGTASRAAMRTKAGQLFKDAGVSGTEERWVRGHPLTPALLSGFVSENIRFEFERQDSRAELTFRSGATIRVVWPVDAQAFFWIEYPAGMQVTSAAKAKAVLSPIGLVPTLSGIEFAEKRLNDEYLKSNVDTRLSSRHFRNHLQMVRESGGSDFSELLSFILEYTPELKQLQLVDAFRDGSRWLDLYYTERGSRREKELYWAGDGMQIWLQVLFHLWRTRELPTVILDEPDVFLHPDLQRRLIHLLETREQQTIMATHAAEMANEAEDKSIVWVERTRSRARRVGDERTFSALSTGLGTGFNLAVARALRSRVALFVEGEDMKVIRQLAKRVGAGRVAEERSLTVIPIGGYSHWPSVEAFGWLKSELLGATVEVFVILDRDYRTDEKCTEVELALAKKGVKVHIWKRKELENYLIEPPALARLSGLPEVEVIDVLGSLAAKMKPDVFGQFLARALEEKAKGVDVATATGSLLPGFESMWADESLRLNRVSGKVLLRLFNAHLQSRRLAPLPPRSLATRMLPEEIDEEVHEMLSRLEAILA